jgi:hypothetical protein
MHSCSLCHSLSLLFPCMDNKGPLITKPKRQRIYRFTSFPTPIKPGPCLVVGLCFVQSHALRRELQDWVGHELSSYRKPQWIEYLSDLPRTTGKLQRFKLRELPRTAGAPSFPGEDAR